MRKYFYMLNKLIELIKAKNAGRQARYQKNQRALGRKPRTHWLTNTEASLVKELVNKVREEEQNIMQGLSDSKSTMFLESVDGNYEPSFFIIRMLSGESIEECIDNNVGTFTHEYIHFIQDLMLPYCMRENLVALSKFFDLRDSIVLRGEVRLPDTTFLEGEELVNLQSDFTWGGNKIVISVSDINSISIKEKYIPEQKFTLRSYYIDFDRAPKYHFGARDLLEYIAYKIESKHCSQNLELPDLPYKTLDFFLDYYKVDFLSEIKRVALAEYCLLNDNPVNMLHAIIDSYEKDTKYHKYWHGSDDGFINFLMKLTFGKRQETINEKLDRRCKDLLNLLQEKFPENSFNAISNWITNTIDFVRSDLAGNFLFASLIQMETSEFNSKLMAITKEIGIPLVTNNRNELYTKLDNERDKDQFIQFLLAYEFSSYLKRTDPICPIYSSCEHNYQQLIDQDCLDAPFRKAYHNDACPFGVFIKTHNLDKIQWYVNGNIIPSQGSGYPFI